MVVKPVRKRGDRGGAEQGMTLVEVMVAMLLLAMVATMVYSILNRAMVFHAKGEEKVSAIEKRQGLLALLQRQVRSGWYDERLARVVLKGEDDTVWLVTRAPLLYPEQGTVLAIYRLDRENGVLYYMEKRDFYIPENRELVPDFVDMSPLLRDTGDMDLFFDEERGCLCLRWQEKSYDFWPWCSEELKGVEEDDEGR